jgi:hypothetical protein
MSGRVYPAAKVAAVLVLTLATGACARGETTTAQPTPVSGGDVLSFADLMTPKKETPSPSPSPSPTSTGTRTSSGSRGSSGSRPSSSGPSAAQAASSGPANCPGGVVSGDMGEFTAAKLSEKSNDGKTQWRVQVTGSVLNQTPRSVRDIRVTVTLHTDNAESDSDGATIGSWVGRNTSAGWRADFDEYESDNEPDEDDVNFRVSGWSWGDPALAQCPTPGWSS